MKLFRESSFDWQDNIVDSLIVEKSGPNLKKKSYFVEGIFMQSEIQNKNGRVYPKKVLENEINRYNREMVKTKRAVGELGHPDSPTISYERVSHIIESLKFNGNNVIGKARITENLPMGKLVVGLIEDGIKFGVSSRALGSLKEDGKKQIVQDDLFLSAVDIVHDPSAPSAFVNGLMEGKEWICENGLWKAETIEKSQSEIKSASSRELEERILTVFDKLINKIEV